MFATLPKTAAPNGLSSGLTPSTFNPTQRSGFSPIESRQINTVNSSSMKAENPGRMQSLDSNYYATANRLSPLNPNTTDAIQNGMRGTQNERNINRLTKLEDEYVQRRDSTKNLQQIGLQLIQSQMDVQEQVLQYQFMLEQCMESLDYQNFILNGQAEELTFLRTKLQYFEKIMDSIKQIKKGNQRPQNGSQDLNLFDLNFLNVRNPSSIQDQSNLPVFHGHQNSSQFQPTNKKHASLNSQFSNLNESRSMTPSMPFINNSNAPISNPISITNN